MQRPGAAFLSAHTAGNGAERVSGTEPTAQTPRPRESHLPRPSRTSPPAPPRPTRGPTAPYPTPQVHGTRHEHRVHHVRCPGPRPLALRDPLPRAGEPVSVARRWTPVPRDNRQVGSGSGRGQAHSPPPGSDRGWWRRRGAARRTGALTNAARPTCPGGLRDCSSVVSSVC